jgi:hypothetical protein
MEHKLLWPAILIMKLGIFCRFRNEPRWLKSFCPLAWRSTAESVHPRLLREASLVGHLVAILIAPFFYLLIAPLSLAWYASILRRFLISLLSFSSRPSAVQSSPPCGALRHRLSPLTSNRGRGCQSSPYLALASPPRGSIFLRHRKNDVQRG